LILVHGHSGRSTRDELQLQPAVCCRQQFHLTLTAVEDSRRPALYASLQLAQRDPPQRYTPSTASQLATSFTHVVYGKGVVRFGGGKKQ